MAAGPPQHPQNLPQAGAVNPAPAIQPQAPQDPPPGLRFPHVLPPATENQVGQVSNAVGFQNNNPVVHIPANQYALPAGGNYLVAAPQPPGQGGQQAPPVLQLIAPPPNPAGPSQHFPDVFVRRFPGSTQDDILDYMVVSVIRKKKLC